MRGMGTHMVYSAPVNAACEVSSLAQAGAGELYCGLQEAWWTERYGDHDSISRRQGRANLATREELAATATAARTYGLPLFLALNGQYDERQLDYTVGLAKEFEEMGGSGIIVRDLGLLLRLEKANSGLKRVLSLLAVCANAPSVQAYADFGVSRIVFPRFLGASEVGGILRACAESGLAIEAESMVFFDKCPLVDGYCTHYHGVGYPERTGSDANLPGKPLFTFNTSYRTHACLGKSCDYLEPYPCAACELAHMQHEGVHFGKLGGRGRPLEERVRALAFLRAAQDLGSDAERAKLYERTFGCACACYYDRNAQHRGAVEPVHLAEIAGRTYVGDVRDGLKLRDGIRQLCDAAVAGKREGRDGVLTLLVGPLSQADLEPSRWNATVDELRHALASCGSASVHLCANDVGTLAALSTACHQLEDTCDCGDSRGRIVVTVGPLLTRGDRPAEFENFTSSQKNPPRPVWDLEGRPRVLTFRSVKEVPLLWEHWTHLMDYDQRTSYREALARVAGNAVEAEFAYDA